MPTTKMQSAAELVEQFRSTGYSGRAPLIATAPLPIGTCTVALRQLEVMATHVAAAWLDGGMNEKDFFQIVKDCLLGYILPLADVVQGTFQSTPRFPFEAAWRGTERLIQEFSVARPGGETRSGELAVSFLIAAMVLRQLAENELASSGKNGLFRSSSTNVAPQFFDRCIDVLGWRPFDASEQVPLSDLERQLEDLTGSVGPLLGDAPRQRIA